MTVTRFQKMLLDEVGDDFGVGFGGELVAFLNKLFLQGEVVLDDAVVHHNNSARAIAVRVGVFFAGPAVSRPARVTDTVGTIERLLSDNVFEVSEFTFGTADLESFSVAGYRDPSRVVAAVFKFAEALDDDGDDLLLADVSDDAAHKTELLSVVSAGAGAFNKAPLPVPTLPGRLIFEGVAIFFDYRICQHFAGDAFHFGLRVSLAQAIFQRQFEVFALANVP